TSLHFCADESDYRRRDGQLCLVRRRHYRRTEKHDRLCRTARDQGNDPPGFAERISDRGISRGTRFDRPDRPPQKNARDDQPVARLFLFRVVNVVPPRREAPRSYQESLAWLYSLQRFGIKLGLENIRRLIA